MNQLTDHETVDFVEAARAENPKLSYEKACRSVGVNPASYYAARRRLGLTGKLEEVDMIRPDSAILKAKPWRPWSEVSARWEGHHLETERRAP
jgi:hypothetical protein